MRGTPPDTACTRSNAFGVNDTDVEPARHPQAVRHVRLDLFARQRLQRAADRNALIELPQLAACQHVEQVQLPDDDDLQQLLIVGLEVREDPDLFEHVRSTGAAPRR